MHIHTCCSCFILSVKSCEGLCYRQFPVLFDSYCLSLQFFHTDHKMECANLFPPVTVCFISFALLRGNLQCLWRNGSLVSVPTDHQTSFQPWLLTAASLSSSSQQTPNREEGRLCINRKGEGAIKMNRERELSVRLNDVSFLQQHRGNFNERLQQSIDRPSGIDTVKARME